MRLAAAKAGGRTMLMYGNCLTKSARTVKAQASGDLKNGSGTVRPLGLWSGTWIGAGKGEGVKRNDFNVCLL